MAGTKSCESVHFRVAERRLASSPLIHSASHKNANSTTKDNDDNHNDASIFCNFEFDYLQPLEELHIDGDSRLLESLIRKKRPSGLLLSIHKSLIAITCLNGSMSFIVRRGCKHMKEVLRSLFCNFAIPIYLGGCSAVEAYETLLFYEAAELKHLAGGVLHCLHPVSIAMGEDEIDNFNLQAKPPQFADLPDDLSLTLASIAEWIDTWRRMHARVRQSSNFNQQLYCNLLNVQLPLALVNLQAARFSCLSEKSPLQAFLNTSAQLPHSQCNKSIACSRGEDTPHKSSRNKRNNAFKSSEKDSRNNDREHVFMCDEFKKHARAKIAYDLSTGSRRISCTAGPLFTNLWDTLSQWQPESGNTLLIAAIMEMDICVAAELSKDTQLMLAVHELQNNGVELWQKVLGKDACGGLTDREKQSARILLSSFVLSHDSQSLWRLATKQKSLSHQEAATVRATLVDMFPQVAQWQEAILVDALAQQMSTTTTHSKQPILTSEGSDSSALDGVVHASITEGRTAVMLAVLDESRKLFRLPQEFTLLAFWDNILIAEAPVVLRDVVTQEAAGCLSRAWHRVFPESSGLPSLHVFATVNLRALPIEQLS